MSEQPHSPDCLAAALEEIADAARTEFPFLTFEVGFIFGPVTPDEIEKARAEFPEVDPRVWEQPEPLCLHVHDYRGREVYTHIQSWEGRREVYLRTHGSFHEDGDWPSKKFSGGYSLADTELLKEAFLASLREDVACLNKATGGSL